jgi:2-oxoisovalerate dehydrogenase E2 component (dihydrolipoyl transacylase)
MNTFNLPDLGEGLQEAELVSWHVNVGDHVVADQPLVSVETAKAVVEVPSPCSGRIARLIGEPGDIIKVGAPIVEFTDDGIADQDAGTVVGTLPRVPHYEKQPHLQAVAEGAEHLPMKASPAARALAHELGISLTSIEGTGPGGTITRADVEAKADTKPQGDGYELLRGVRRAMAVNMARSAIEVASSTVSDEVLIGHWPRHTDVTVRLIRAVVAGCRAEPALNAWFDKARMARKFHANIDLGLAMNIGDGLFAPVLRNVAARTDRDIRASIDALKQDIAARKVEPATLAGPTITLSNFGMLGGREASLAIVPPQVAILGAGRIFDTVQPVNGEIRITKALPLSLTFDHRVVTGAEAVRFLSAALAELAKPT